MSFFFFFFNDTATTEIYTLSLHDALPIYRVFPEVDDHVVALSDVNSKCAWSDNRVSHDGVAVVFVHAIIDRNRMLEEIGISGDHNNCFNIASGADERKVPLGLCRAGRENPEPVLSVSDSHPRLNLSVDDELVDRKSTRLNSSHITISYAVF